ncbi:uncharacterized protein LOC106152575 [Lingula anatina]|uniref:Glycosyltransferase family 92 protein n=1 Tax=Lingula anatina TaxID=7574 RepID=A0A1S3H951_LINAN|nr:uncharacterized protein LOC106152575 [Lingula anatina]|eukprot:XP_013381654.1 uncharacterized protein LOC106152575 [Lingula anatina]
MRVRLKRTLVWIIGLYLFIIYYFFNPSANYLEPYIKDIVQPGLESRQIVKNGKLPETTTTTTECTTEKLTVIPSRADYKSCPKLSPPPFDTPDRQDFLPVGEEGTFYTFSAFVDDRLGKNGVLVVISIGDPKGKLPRFCQAWYNAGRDNTTGSALGGHANATVFLNIIPGKLEKYPEGHGRRFNGYAFHCPLTSQLLPYAASLAYNECDIPARGVLKVLNTKPTKLPVKPKFEFAVCITPMSLQYDNVNQFVEMVEMNRELGAEHFTFYNYSIGPRVAKVLKHYTKQGVADLIQWPLPIKANIWPPVKGQREEIHYYGQVVALNDCFNRYMHKADFTVMTDMDEFIVPRVDMTWKKLVQSLGGMKPHVGSFLFKNAFFKAEWPNDESLANNKSINEFNLLTQLKTKREKKVSRPRSRSKYFVITERSRIVGIHYVWKNMPGYKDHVVPEEIAMLFHYRNWDNPDDKNWIVDRTMHKYSDSLLRRVQNVYHTVQL